MMFGWFVILIAAGFAVWGFGQGRGPWRGPGTGGHEEGRAEMIPREQYARGKVDEETYRRKLNELRRT